ncbi:MAG: hypothetical protein K0S65_2278 [Labilithrix sp.]|nr:hypothetical protein [Labilithrix sp.]
MRLFVRYAALSTLLFTGFVACSTKQRGFDPPPPPLIEQIDASVPDARSCEGRRCSRDLHTVLDGCSGDVVETCREDQGCGAGKCLTPCEAVSLAQGSLGCSFWTTPPDAHLASDASCFAAFVANTWSTPATVRASFGSDPLDVSRSVYRAIPSGSGVRYERIEGPIPPGEVGIVFLSQGEPGANSSAYIGCPAGVDVAWHGTAVVQHATSVYRAFHLETDVPVSAYSMFPYGGAQSYIPSATLLLPTTSWGTNYILVDGYDGKTDDPPFVQVVAQEDDTIVKIRPQVEIHDGPEVKGTRQGIVGSWTLQRGQVLEFHQDGSLAGSPLEANHPVALFGGTQCPYIPANIQACDTLQQQIAPINQWGSTYSAVPYKSRRGSSLPEAVVWRIGAARDGTTLTYEPTRPQGAPLTLSSGQFVYFEAEHNFRVRSQDADYPIYLATFMTGAERYQTDGDPDFVNIVPDEQFLDSYVFFVDHTYANSSLTVVRKKDAKGFHDVNLDCLGTITGWQPLGNDGDVELTWIDMSRAGSPVKNATGTCGYGRHEASSDGPFALYVWGIDYAASYGYPAGAGSRPTSPFRIVVQ